jgi:hypothetical protein
MQLATEHDLILRVTPRPGYFVIQGSALAAAWPGERVDERLAEKIHDAFIVGAGRTLTQDVEFAVDQLVEVAVRALSPGVNDPFTAMTCVDRLGEALCQLAERTLPSPSRYDADGRLRVVVHPTTFTGVTDAAFNQIRQYGRGSAAVTIRLLEAIAGVAARASGEEDRAALLQQARMIKRGSVDLRLIRQGEERTVQVNVAEMPEEQRQAAVGGDTPEGKLGLAVQELPPEIARSLDLSDARGVVVTGVAAGSPADEVGIRRGDAILEVNQQTITNLQEYRAALSRVEDGAAVLFLIRRGDNVMYVALRPEDDA